MARRTLPSSATINSALGVCLGVADWAFSCSPLFVTWNIQKPGGRHHLRGCIGNFNPLALHEGLASYALTSALEDTRFDPVRANEIPFLDCGVSLLIDFEPAQRWDDWEVRVIYVTALYR